MSLQVDPELIVNLLKNGYYNKEDAQKQINNLMAEISSGVYTLAQLGLSSMKSLRNLVRKSKKTMH